MHWIEYLALACLYEAALDATCTNEPDSDQERFLMNTRREIAAELLDEPAPRGWRAQINTCTYRTWE